MRERKGIFLYPLRDNAFEIIDSMTMLSIMGVYTKRVRDTSALPALSCAVMCCEFVSLISSWSSAVL